MSSRGSRRWRGDTGSVAVLALAVLAVAALATVGVARLGAAVSSRAAADTAADAAALAAADALALGEGAAGAAGAATTAAAENGAELVECRCAGLEALVTVAWRGVRARARAEVRLECGWGPLSPASCRG